MQFYGSLDSLLEYGNPQPPSYFKNQNSIENTEQKDPLENLLQEKAQCLADILGQIDLDIKSRKELSLNVIYRIYQHYCYLKSNVLELYTWELGRNRGIEIRRVRLEKQLDSLKQEKRQEQVQCWQDIAQLKKEFRTWFKQHCDLVQRVKIILPGKITKNCSNKLPILEKIENLQK